MDPAHRHPRDISARPTSPATVQNTAQPQGGIDTSKFSMPSDQQGSPTRSLSRTLQQTGADPVPRSVNGGPVLLPRIIQRPTTLRPLSQHDLTRLAADTKQLIPHVLAKRPDVVNDSYLRRDTSIDSLQCPGLPPVTIRVVDKDTVDTAIQLSKQRPVPHQNRPVAILNMANRHQPGGGWERGAMAQEEAICYRTSLSATFDEQHHYPIPRLAATYAPTVAVFRKGADTRYHVMDYTSKPEELEKLAVISCAAIRRPRTRRDAAGQDVYSNKHDETMMLEKMRIILRTAIIYRHRILVLGAFGCGAFRNPNHKVAAMWKRVLQEKEFSGGWWKDITFAVLSGSGSVNNNYQVFKAVLDGVTLS